MIPHGNLRFRSVSALSYSKRFADPYGPNTEVADRISKIDPTRGKIIIAVQGGVSDSANVAADLRDFAPHCGFAATVAKGNVVRGGYGISFVPNMIASSMAMRNPRL